MRSLVIGAGWAGLTCAYELCKAGHQVTVLEAAPQIGGRARSINFANTLVDNGQHVCIGAYHNLSTMLQDLGLRQNQLFQNIPLDLILHGTKTIRLRAAPLQAPWHLINGILLAKNLRISDKLSLLKCCNKFRATNFVLANDCSVAQLLKNYHQNARLIKLFWEPLALAIMTTDINQASAQVFLNVLQKSFTKQQKNSNWMLPKVDLDALLPNHISEYLLKHGCQIICGAAVKNLACAKKQCTTVYSKDNSWSADNVIICTQPEAARSLLETIPECRNLCQQLQQISHEAITTLYFEFPHAVHLQNPVQGFVLEDISIWVFDRAFCGQENIISLIISGNGSHVSEPSTTLTSKMLQHLRNWFPHLSTPLQSKLIREKRAAFRCSVAQQQIRPGSATAIANLWLCGDYIQNGLPATLEGAIINGKHTASLILNGGREG